MIPRFSPRVTAWVRSLAPSLERMLFTWPLTVSSVIERSLATNLLAFPAAAALLSPGRSMSRPSPRYVSLMPIPSSRIRTLNSFSYIRSPLQWSGRVRGHTRFATPPAPPDLPSRDGSSPLFQLTRCQANPIRASPRMGRKQHREDWKAGPRAVSVLPTMLVRHDFVAARFLESDGTSRVLDDAYAVDAGMVSSISVPESGLLQTCRLPPTSLALSCMPRRPQ